LPAIRILEANGEMKTDLVTYSFDESSLKSNKIISFVSRFFDGKLQPFIRSENIPEKSYEDYIRNIVGYNFEVSVRDDHRNVFVLFYEKSCGHCDTVFPF
jgi:protein disulfide-isomerase A1